MKKHYLIYQIFLFTLIFNSYSTEAIDRSKDNIKKTNCFCTASDSNAFALLINLIGSIHKTNLEYIDEIVVFNIGLDNNQIEYLNLMKKVKVYEVEKVNPDITKSFQVNDSGKRVPGWYSWKPVAIKQAVQMFDNVLWIDAGTTILKPLDHLFKYIEEHNYFASTISAEKRNNKFIFPINWQTTQYLINRFNLNSPESNWILEQNVVTTHVIGISKSVYKTIVEPFYETARDIKNFIDDGTTPNGLGTGRHDQAVFSILCYLKNLKTHDQDYSQTNPINLKVNNNLEPLYITWDYRYVCDKTHIYHSRGNIEKLEYYHSLIQFK
jgi:hypothetical protein